MTVKCCVCDKTRINDQWLAQTSAAAPEETVSHSYCPSCLHCALAEADSQERWSGGGGTPRLQWAAAGRAW